MATTVREGATDLYRYFDADDRLLYVGISFSSIVRAAQHRQEKGWWSEFTRMDVERFDTRDEAKAAELHAIRTESPIHNVVGKRKVVTKKTVAAPWRCGRCDVPVGLKKGDGYIHVEWNVLWTCVCPDCDEVGDNTRYWIDAYRVNTPAEIVQWTSHLCGKRWFVPGEWSDCIWRSCTIPHAHALALNIIDKSLPGRAAQREWDEMHAARHGDAIKFYGMEQLAEAAAFIEAREHEIRTGSIQKIWKLNYMKHDECGMYAKIHHTSDRRALGHFYCWKCRDHFRVWGGTGHRWPKDIPVWPDGLDDQRQYGVRDRLWAEHVASVPPHMAATA